MPSESELQAALLLAAPRALPDMRLFRRNVGLARTVRGAVVRFAVAGQSDLYALCRGGQHAEIELKAAGGRLRPEQRAWAEWCAGWGVPHILLAAEPDESIEQTVSRWCTELRLKLQ